MDMLALTHDEIKAALVEGYEAEYDEYKRWEDAAKTLAHEQETDEAKAAKRMADNRSHRLDGFKAAVAALGISENELLQAVREIAEGGAAQ